MKHIALSLILLLVTAITRSYAQTQVDTCIIKLQSAESGDVFRARNILLSRHEKDAIPKLVLLLKDTTYVKLVNTADLIYPGAKEFYGHGRIVNYDIDWISVRAAWILEDITFQDFGFLSQKPIDEKALMTLHKSDYQSYLEKRYHNVNYADTTLAGRLIRSRRFLSDKAAKWWNSNKNNWTKLKALQGALASGNEHRESLAIHYLRFGNDFETPSDTKVRKSYYPQLKKLVVKVKNSKGSESKQADYLLKDMADIK